MAIKRTLDRDQTEIKAPLPEAYTRVHSIESRWGDFGEEVQINFNTYADATARAARHALAVNKEGISVPLADFIALGAPTGWTRAEVVAAAYRYLKTLRDNAGNLVYGGTDV